MIVSGAQGPFPTLSLEPLALVRGRRACPEPSRRAMMDGNAAVASVAYRASEVIAIYPITPATDMGTQADILAAARRPNIWGLVPRVVEMQSEGGAAGALHGAITTGALGTTFTASQGLLLMIANMYKIAGELTAAVIHVAAREVATHALSIFGGHSDVMAVRDTGFALLSSGSVQEAMDMAMIAHAATLRSRVPFLHFMDGFRTSHELATVEEILDEVVRAMIPNSLLLEHRARGLTPDRPQLRGTAQNPDHFMQMREAANPFYTACPDITQGAMDKLAELTGRQYRLFEYHGAPDAERVIVMMGSGAETVQETVDYMNHRGEKVGLVKVRLYRPFDARRFVEALPASTRTIAVLDRTKAPGGVGEPLYIDCVTAIHEGDANGWRPPQLASLGWGERPTPLRVVGGRYGFSSKEFTPAMAMAVFANLAETRPKNHFTVGITDDVGHTSLAHDPTRSIEADDVTRALFWGLGSDGTVGGNKASIKIIGDKTDLRAQAYFDYDSKKAGSVTISHLRFGPRPIHAPYKVTDANFIACHQWSFVDRYDMLEAIRPGGTFLLNSPYGPQEVWEHLPRKVQESLVAKNAKLYVINAARVARDCGLGGRINTTMQVCFFKLSGVIPLETAIEAIKDSIRETYGKKGEAVVQKNLDAVDQALANLHEVDIADRMIGVIEMRPPVAAGAPPFVCDVLGEIIARRGDRLPVSAFPVDGTFPTGTARYEKRDIATEVPIWEAGLCIECGKCAVICPHGVERIKAFDPAELARAPRTFQSCDAHDREWKALKLKYVVQASPMDCTGCTLCVDACPPIKRQGGRRALSMQPLTDERRAAEVANWAFFESLPDIDRRRIDPSKVRTQALQRPLFEFSGACAGCGETPYLSMLSRLVGDRLFVANATGCSSIVGGNLPTTPWAVDAAGRGPAWSSNLFEDAAEFALGFRLSVDQQREMAVQLLMKMASRVGEDLATSILAADQKDEAGIIAQRERVAILKEQLGTLDTEASRLLLGVADMLVKKSVWAVGGDGWAYDIGYGGLDHVLASGEAVKMLVLDTEVYSNTKGQTSKATPRGATAQFAVGGKPTAKKELGLMAMAYPDVYVASVAIGANMQQTLRAMNEAESFEGPALVLAYSACIEHGIDMATAMQQDLMVKTGQWILFRRDPRRAAAGQNPLVFDSPDTIHSKKPTRLVEEFLLTQQRFRRLKKERPKAAAELFRLAQEDVDNRWRTFEYLAAQPPS